MLKNYFKTAWRNLVKNKMHSVINIAGLAVGMAVALLIGLWIYDELSFNKNFKNYERIAQVYQRGDINGQILSGNTLPYPIGEELRKKFGSNFKYVTMASYNNSHILSYNEKVLMKNGTYLEPQALEMFTVKMLKGTHRGLDDPSSIMLSETAAKAYFNDADPIGKVMKIDNKLDVKITGVYEDMPDNSSFANTDFIAPWQLMLVSEGWLQAKDPWRCNCFFSYTQIADHADMKKVSAKIRDIKLPNVDKSELKQKPQVFLFPMKRWHLYSEFQNGI